VEGGGNEANNPQFLESQDAAMAETKLMATTYQYLENDISAINAAMPGANKSVDFIGGDIDSTHNPVGFTDEIAQDIKTLGLPQIPFNEFGDHPYHEENDNGALQAQEAAEVAKDFGVPFEQTEYGVSTNTVSEQQQGADYVKAIGWAVCNNIPVFIFFHLFDEPDNPNGQTGLYYPLKQWPPQPKSDLQTVETAIINARTGNVSCPVIGPTSG
jgi:hypothetical protein